MIEFSKPLKGVLQQLSNVLKGDDWEVRTKRIAVVDEFGNRRTTTGWRVVKKIPGIFSTSYGTEEYCPLMICMSSKWLSDDEWDGDLALFESSAERKGVTKQELEALVAALDGRLDHPNPLVQALNKRIQGMMFGF